MADNKPNQPQTKAPEAKAPETSSPTPETPNPGVKELRVQLLNPTKVEFIVCNTGERNSRMVHEPKFILTKGVLFKIPLVDKTLNYASFSVVKLVSPYTESFRVLDIVNGIATLEAIVHGSFVENDMLLGYIF